MDILAASFASGGVLGAAARMAVEPSPTREMFKDGGSGAVAVVFIILFVIGLIIFTILLSYAIYKIVPVNKGMHLAGTIFLGGLWYIPLLFYYGYNNYELKKNMY